MRTLLGIDVGGTNTRARAVMMDDLGQMLTHPQMPEDQVRQFTSTSQLTEFISDLTESLGVIEAVAIAVAGPVSGASARITNWSGTPEIVLSDLIRRGLPAGNTTLCNDLVAGAHGVLARMDSPDVDVFTSLGGPDGPPVLGQGHLVYVAPGTGLGAATLVSCGGTRYQALGCEAQHTPAHAPAGTEARHERIQASLGHAPSWEDIVSGVGLTLLHDVCSEADRPTYSDAETVARQAAENDPLACQAIEAFYDYLAGFCQILALGATPCEAVIVGGATTRVNLSVLSTSRFAQRFADNPVHGELLGKTRLRAIAEDINLDGCLRIAALTTTG